MKQFLLLAAFAVAAHAQFQLVSVSGSTETPVAPVFDFGSVTSGDLAVAKFRVRNTSSAPAPLYVLSLAGTGFTMPAAPVLPQTLDPQGAIDFAVVFQASAGGSYSAALTLPGIPVILTATVIPGLLYRIASPVGFGSVEVGSTATIHGSIENDSDVPLPLPPLLISGTGFSVQNAPPGGIVLDPQHAAGFDLLFSPASTGSYTGSLVAGDHTFALSGAGVGPPALKPVITVDLPQAVSGQQGTLRVTLETPSPITTGGAVTLDFQGPDDPAVTFAIGVRSVSFKVIAGQTNVFTSPFQTGTTAGTLIFSVFLNGVTTSQSITIAPASIAISAAQASRSNNALVLDVTGFDNTRTAGPLAFTFYDRAGNLIAPSPIQTTADFTDFFQTSGLGGLFHVKASFPVNGDPAQIAAFEVQFTNTAGTATTGRTGF